MKLSDTASELEVSGENVASNNNNNNSELLFDDDGGGEFDENDESLLDDTTPPVYDDDEDDMNSSSNGHNDCSAGVNPCDEIKSVSNDVNEDQPEALDGQMMIDSNRPSMPETDNQKLSMILFKKTGIVPKVDGSSDQLTVSKSTGSINSSILSASYNQLLFNMQHQQMLNQSVVNVNNNNNNLTVKNGLVLSPKSLSSSSSSFLSSASSSTSTASSSMQTSGKKVNSSFSIDSLINTNNNQKSALNKLDELSVTIKKSTNSNKKLKKLKKLNNSDLIRPSHPSSSSSSSSTTSSHSDTSSLIDTSNQLLSHLYQPAASSHLAGHYVGNNTSNSSTTSCSVSPISPITCYTSSNQSVAEINALRLRNFLHTLSAPSTDSLPTTSSPNLKRPLDFQSTTQSTLDYTNQQAIYNVMLMRAAAAAAAASVMNNSTNIPPSSSSASHLNNSFTTGTMYNGMASFPSMPPLGSQQPPIDIRNLNFSNILPLFLPMHS